MNNTSHTSQATKCKEERPHLTIETPEEPDATPQQALPQFVGTISLTVGRKVENLNELSNSAPSASFYLTAGGGDKAALYRSLADHCRALVEYLTDLENAAIAEKAAEERRAF